MKIPIFYGFSLIDAIFYMYRYIPNMDILDCIVIGAGIQGSATTYHLAKRGLSVLMMDQVSGIVHNYIHSC